MKIFKKFKWQGYVLAGIILTAFLLYIWNINEEGYSNAYYAAAVKSMLSSPKAFFFGSFDSGLYVTVDKPPLGLMIQALSAAVFGVNSFGLIFPSALAGVICIILVYLMVKKVWGPTAGIIASGVMAVTPILVALSRTNNLDMLLMMFMICGAFFVLKAAEKQSLAFYILAMVFFGSRVQC
jgi:4-amino-4-deoxy-L-arabinose transferase-like glycosyltransferase